MCNVLYVMKRWGMIIIMHFLLVHRFNLIWTIAILHPVLHNTGCMELLIQLICFDIYRHEDSDIAGWVAMLICCIWHNRNDKVWNNHSVDATQLGHHAFNSWNDWYDVHKQQELREQSCATLEALQYWCMFLCGEWCYLLCVLL
jgi:hypothetical protein